VTVCATDRACLFGEVAGDRMVLGALGRIVHSAWQGVGRYHDGIDLDALIVMPNHVHAIVILDRSSPRRPPPIPAVVGMAKARASRRAGVPIWQRGFHDRVIRDERELEAAREYIETNPMRWALDRENPERLHGRRAG
jgi:REP element-mobilizing transposase RayT